MRVSRLLAALLAGLFALALTAGSGPHDLAAQGDMGWMKVWGDGTIELSGKGTLTVKNESNLQVTINGTWESAKNISDGTIYNRFEGSLRSVGLGAHFELRGWNLRLAMRGRGKAHFQGYGTASLDGGEAIPWPADQTHNRWLKLTFRD
jgi:hypothetical protein